MQGLFSRVSDELKTKAGALEIEEALEEMTAKIEGSANEQSRLQRLARTLGRDQNSTTAMKRLKMELEQVGARVPCRLEIAGCAFVGCELRNSSRAERSHTGQGGPHPTVPATRLFLSILALSGSTVVAMEWNVGVYVS